MNFTSELLIVFTSGATFGAIVIWLILKTFRG